MPLSLKQLRFLSKAAWPGMIAAHALPVVSGGVAYQQARAKGKSKTRAALSGAGGLLLGSLAGTVAGAALGARTVRGVFREGSRTSRVVELPIDAQMAALGRAWKRLPPNVTARQGVKATMKAIMGQSVSRAYRPLMLTGIPMTTGSALGSGAYLAYQKKRKQ